MQGGMKLFLHPLSRYFNSLGSVKQDSSSGRLRSVDVLEKRFIYICFFYFGFFFKIRVFGVVVNKYRIVYCRERAVF